VEHQLGVFDSGIKAVIEARSARRATPVGRLDAPERRGVPLSGVVAVAGLNGTKTINRQPFDVAAYRFTDLWRLDGGSAPFWKQKGHMVLTPSQKLARNKIYDVHFVLENADVGQDVRRCEIHLSKILQELEFAVRVDDFLREPLLNEPGNRGPLLVFDFLAGDSLSFITQSTPSAAAANTITVGTRTCPAS